MIKSDGSFLGFFARPIAATLGIATLAIWAALAWRSLAHLARKRG
jgi:hypothetical protein